MIYKKVLKYVTESQKCYFDEWYFNLSQKKQAVVSAYIKRLAGGGSKRNIKPLKNGVFEVKIKTLGGLRAYFGEEGGEVVLLLLGGDKSSQNKDIILAKRLWSDYGKSKQKF